MEVIGCELLFRMGWENSFRGEIDEAARKMMDHCLYVGLESFTKGGLAFVNCTRDALLGGLITLLPPQTTVVELLETIQPGDEVLQACKHLRQLGYRIALDDFVPAAEWQPLVEIADYVKVDFRLSGPEIRREIVRMTKHSRAALLAEKVEDQHDLELAQQDGYEYFQGYFFCRPKIVANREIPPNRMNYLRLLVQLTRSPLNVDEVLRVVEREASLCYRLLRLANSALWGLREDVTSVRQAFMLVGEERFRMLVTVAATSALGHAQSPALVNLSLERARFCELAAPLVGEDPTEQFMLGLMSLLDAMLDAPMQQIAESLPFRSEARAALAGARNSAAVPLCLIRSFELGGWSDCSDAVHLPGVSEERLTELYLEAVQWANDSVAASG